MNDDAEEIKFIKRPEPPAIDWVQLTTKRKVKKVSRVFMKILSFFPLGIWKSIF